MLRSLVTFLAAALMPLASHGAPCELKVMQPQAISIAKREFEKTRRKGAAAYYRWTAERHDCIWFVTGHTPPQSWAGDARVDIDAQTGKATVHPVLRTDPRKIPAKARNASNQALELIQHFAVSS
jgi:hypothetical protein